MNARIDSSILSLPMRSFRGCGAKGKLAYSKADAQRALRQLQTTADDPHADALNIYRCQDCGRWHVGHRSYHGTPIPAAEARKHA